MAKESAAAKKKRLAAEAAAAEAAKTAEVGTEGEGDEGETGIIEGETGSEAATGDNTDLGSDNSSDLDDNAGDEAGNAGDPEGDPESKSDPEGDEKSDDESLSMLNLKTEDFPLEIEIFNQTRVKITLPVARMILNAHESDTVVINSRKDFARCQSTCEQLAFLNKGEIFIKRV